MRVYCQEGKKYIFYYNGLYETAKLWYNYPKSDKGGRALQQLTGIFFFASRIVLCVIAVFVLARCFFMLMRKKISSEELGALYNAANGDELELKSYETSIGRSKLCDITLGYATVSRFHAVIAYRKGGFYVYDTNSKMGVFVNGVKIDKPTAVFNGDNIAFGTIPMKLLCKEDKNVEPLDERENRYIKSVIADTKIEEKKPKFDTDEIPNVYEGGYLYNEMNGEKLHLMGNCVVFGRDPDQCDIWLNFAFVSRVHARLLKYREGWAVEDMKSTAGTFLNGEKLEKPRLLKDGDIISLGGINFVYRQGGIQ